MDGVLADSGPWWSEIDAALLAEHGVAYRGEYHRDVLGVSYPFAIEFYKKAFRLLALTDEMMRRPGRDRVQLLRESHSDLRLGEEVLHELRAMDLRLAVGTSS
jgi:beta-phosphoglucomutase-like phosphatase (HAD superfamily)